MDFQHSHQHQQQQMNAGLTRYRSAPSSYFASVLDSTTTNTSSSRAGGFGGDDLDHFLNNFMPSNHISSQGQSSNPSASFSNSMSMQSQSEFVPLMKQEPDVIQQQQLQQQNIQNDYSQVSRMIYQGQDQAQAQAQPLAQQNHNPKVSDACTMDSSYRLLNSVNSNRFVPLMKMETGGGGGGNSNLIRYNSSPAGLFANINIEKEYGAMRGTGNSGAGNNANAEASFSSTSRFKGFSTGQSSSGQMSPIAEVGTKGMGETSASNRSIGEGEGPRNDGYLTGFPVSSWDDSSILSDDFLKGLGDSENKIFSTSIAAEKQNNEGQKDSSTLLSRHLSLPNTSAEFSAMETLMQDSVLCKLRAKRGCATHPRSIAERVRRTRISERMRKLQDLVPNMDKQTNTSDMLDLAVDYIKDLQKQVKALSDNRAKCTCSNH